MILKVSLGHVVWYHAKALTKKLGEHKINRTDINLLKSDELVSKYSYELLSSMKTVGKHLLFSSIY